MKRVLLAGVLGALTVFVWGAISWMVLPWHPATVHNIPDGEPVVEMLRDRDLLTGVYHYPGELHDEDEPAAVTDADRSAWTDRYRRGPNVNLLVYSSEGSDPFAPATFARGFLLLLIAATLAAYLLSLAAPSLPAYGQRVLFVALLGVFSAVVSRFEDWNWLLFPTDYTLVMAMDLVVGWLLAGLVIGWQIRPELYTPRQPSLSAAGTA